MKKSLLKEQVNNLPKKPGIYIFKDKKRKILYIGKALSLRTRVKNYLTQKRQDPKTKQLLSQVAQIDYQLIHSEFEALLLEAKLIKEHQPKYNLRLKDNKRYLYIVITKAPFRVFPLRRPELEKDLLDWYGPFPSAASVKEVLQLIRNIIPYCSCPHPLKRQCFYYHLKLCPGWKNLDSRQYHQEIKQIRRVLKGKASFLFKHLGQKMKLAAKKFAFEEAQKCKNQIAHLKKITSGWQSVDTNHWQAAEALFKLKKLLVKHQGISPTTLYKIEGYDVSNLGVGIIVGAMVAFVQGQPDKGLYRKFKLNLLAQSCIARITLGQQNDPESIKQIIRRRLNHPEWLYPQLILVDGAHTQVRAAFEVIKEKSLSGQIAVLGLAKKQETIVVPKILNHQIVSYHLLKYSSRSAVLKLLQQIRDESHRFAQKYYHFLHRQKMIKLR